MPQIAVDVADPPGGLLERLLDRPNDAAAEGGVVTAGLGPQLHLRRDNVGGVAAADHAHVAGPQAAILLDPAVPALTVQMGDGQGGDRNGADAFLGHDAGMTRPAANVNVHAVSAGGADGQLMRPRRRRS